MIKTIQHLKKMCLLITIVFLTACSAKIGVPIPPVEGKSKKHPSGTVIIIETESKPKGIPRTKG